MKKKSTVSKLHLDSALIIFVAALVISIVIRAYQLMNGVINPENGFYYQPVGVTKAVLNVVLLISAVLMLVFSFLTSNMPKSVLPKRKNAIMAIAGLVMAGGLTVDAMTQVTAVINARPGYDSFSAFISETHMTPHILQAVFALISAIYFLVFALSYFKGKNAYSGMKVFAVMPVAWLICRLMIRFMRDTNYIKDSELFFEFVMLCFALIFFLAFARIASGLGSKGTMWMVFGCGLPTALFALLCSIPRLIMNIIGRNDFIIENSPLEYVDIAVGAFVILLLITILSEYKSGKYEEYDEDDVSFNVIPEAVPIAPAGEVVPPQYQDYQNGQYAPQSNPHQKHDEAFEIAAQYSNQYIRADENIYVDQAEKYKDAAAEEEPWNQPEQSPADANPYIDPLPEEK